jgi:oxygen-independent coproporphyrinogen-3 oxidase
VHVPFCARACPYCDFDFEVGRCPDLEAYLEGLRREAEVRQLFDFGPFDTVYVGGGTPSLMGSAGLHSLSAWLRDQFELADVREWTVELNPEHVDARLVEALVAIGVTRVSLGVQTFDADGLGQLGRVHTPNEARDAARACLAAGLSTSLDLIVGWPGQGPAGVDDDVRTALDTGVSHVSIYALTIEAGTPWPRLVRRGLRCLPDADAQATCLLQAEAMLIAAGFEHYEVASYARSGHQAQHNQLYWMWRDYVGLGPSAASAQYDADGAVIRRTNQRGLAAWRKLPSQPAEQERLAPQDAAIEGLWTGLRRLGGFEVEAYLQRFPAVTRSWLVDRVARQISRGNLCWLRDQQALRVTPGRWLLHDEIGADLL